MIKSLKDLLDKFSRFTNSLVYDGGICKRLDILDISKIEAGELNIYKKNISLKTLIEELHDLFAPVAQDKDIQFINNFQIKNDNIFIF